MEQERDLCFYVGVAAALPAEVLKGFLKVFVGPGGGGLQKVAGVDVG